MAYIRTQLALFLVLIMPIVFLSTLQADTLFVSQNLKVHTEASLESPVDHLLLGGEEVEILRIDGDFTEIQDKGEHIGWVASEFLSNIKPKNTEKKIADEVKNNPTQMEQTKLKPEKSIKKSANKSVKEKKSPITKVATSTPTPAREIKKLPVISHKVAIEVQQLQLKLDKIRAILEIPYPTNSSITIKKDTNMDLSFIGGALFIGFILGIMWHDFRLRRRHGGYKV